MRHGREYDLVRMTYSTVVELIPANEAEGLITEMLMDEDPACELAGRLIRGMYAGSTINIGPDDDRTTWEYVGVRVWDEITGEFVEPGALDLAA